MRTTLDIDDPVLRQLRKRQKGSGKSLGQVASELLAQALADKHESAAPAQPGTGGSIMRPPAPCVSAAHGSADPGPPSMQRRPPVRRLAASILP